MNKGISNTYQVTLKDPSGKYNYVSALVHRKEGMDKKALIEEGIKKICQKRLWTSKDLKKYGYTVCMIRLYDKEKIEQEKKERYEKIKEEKYASGEWKRPKSAES